MPTIIVFCHLRWDFVFQRPQHLLSRLAQHYRVLVVEEPQYHDGASFMQQTEVAPNVTICQPHTPVQAHGFHDDQIPLLRSLVAQIVPEDEDPIAWFYTPMALPLLPELHARLVVYDCMDELAAFKNSPKQLLQRETALLKVADLVFTGGPSLYEAKKERHASAHCFPSSVDVGHFEQAMERARAHADQEALPHPRLGFYGVIDERFDPSIVAAMAAAHPEWQIVLVGPVVKIDPATLPQAPNIHYMGQRTYAELPQFLAGWDVCLMPFALNEATRFISPTKVLEYMAAQLPIVSTRITDVAKPYGHIVAIADTPEQFIAACERALAMNADEQAALAAQMRAVVSATSWNKTADHMRELMNSTTPAPHSARFLQPEAAGEAIAAANGKVNALPTSKGQGAHHVGTVIIGAGPTGLSAAYHLGQDSVLIDRNPTVGGWCRSIKDNGFTFDYAGHIMFSNDPYVLKMYDMLLGTNLHWQNREAWVWSKNVYTRYPFQGALYGLPPKVITECIMGAVEARYGVADAPAACAQPLVDCCADGTVDISNSSTVARQREPANFEEFIYKVWGKGIAKHFAIPYNRKLWAVPLTEMETSWLGGRVPLPNVEEIIEGALEPVGKPMGPNARFGYPLQGGFQALMNGFLPHLKGELKLNKEVTQVLAREHVVVLGDGSRYRYDTLISTMPLPDLVRMLAAEAPEEVRAAARGLKHISVKCVNLGVARENITDKHWIYYPEDSIFHRIFVQGNASPGCNPPGGFGLTCEITYSAQYKPLPVDGQALIERCIEDCRKVNMLRPDDRIIAANIVDMPYAYVVYDHQRAHNVATIRDWLAQHDILLAGRYSEWEYYNSDHAFIAGKRIAERVQRTAGARRASVSRAD
jgi:protoporphyrinogen oxidase/glycosyltransferase involved in cell wall biosynthesis